MKRALITATLLGAAALVGAYAAGAFGGRTMPSFAPAPAHPLSARTDLRLAKHVRCRGNYPHLVGPDVFSRFHAVTAVECVEGFRTYPGQGQWEVVSRKVAVGGIPNWQRYFEQPDDPNFPPKSDGCTLNLIVLEVPVFVDSQGETLVPRTPVDRCGHPLGLALGEKRIRVRWHTVWVHRIRQSISAPALAANCPMRWGNVVAEGEPKLRPGESFFTPTPHTVRACIYRAPANHVALGQFVRGKRLGPLQTQRLLRALTGSPTSGRCAKQRTFAMILGKGSSLGVSVELGGCWRVAPGFRGRKPHTADASVVSAILGRR